MAAVAFVLKGYPRLSETFIAQEILGLERLGLDARLFSLRRATDRARHPMHALIQAPVTYLPEYLYREPFRVLRAWRARRGSRGYAPALATWLKDLVRDPTPNRVRRFGQALVLAHELPGDVAWLHAHFLHTPASVARYAALLLGLPWSCSAHAKDVWTTPPWELREKLADCRWAAGCSAVNVRHLRGLAADPGSVFLAYHGLDGSRFPPPSAGAAAGDGRDGRDPARPVVILSVGRAVEKKGYAGLIEALGRLSPDLHWRFVHVGGGPQLGRLKRLATRAGISDRVRWLGPLSHADVLEQYRAAHLFALNSRVAPDGDRDGLPNVLLEAQSQGLAVVATSVSAIPELIRNGETGVLVPADDPGALARALETLIEDARLRRRLGAAGRERVASAFAHAVGIETLAERFRGAGLLAPAAAAATR